MLRECLLKELGIAFSELDVIVTVIDDSHSLADLCLYLLGAELKYLVHLFVD